ncbi:MAG: transposase [Flavobacteriia bacterium]
MANNFKYNRKSIRLKGYDYSKNGLYFVTICCHQNMHLFGEVINEEVKLNDIGKMAEKCWLEIPKHFPFCELYEFVIMPNHIHGIIEINNISEGVAKNISEGVAKNISPVLRSPSKTIGSIVRGFKIGVTKYYRYEVQNDSKAILWHRNYYDNIIFDMNGYENIARYIKNNPKNWGKDKLYSKN